MGSPCNTHGTEEECVQGFWWESRKERDHYEDLDGIIILKWIFDGMGWIRVA
jgi:hypothetical protein